MCGIVGYVGARSVLPILVGGLKRLEYRGYDSAGLAYWVGSSYEIKKAEGKLENVEKLLPAGPTASTIGIGHTRWATHGKPTTQNAHPHRVEHVVLVHNGIVENYLEIRKRVLEAGKQPRSETDSELIGFMLVSEMERGASLEAAIRKVFSMIHGQSSVVVVSDREPGVVIGVRNGSPLVVANDPEGGVFFASDAQPILEFTRDVTFLENGDICVGTRSGLSVSTLASPVPIQRPATHLDWSADQMEKLGFAHYMLKEIHEQPTTLIDTLNTLLDRSTQEPFVLAKQPGVELLERAKSIHLIACGTSWHAALLGKYWIESMARVPVQVELASEFRYREPVIGPGALVIGISQSGETADTLAVIRALRAKGVPTLGLTNVRGSTISREAESVFYTAAGPEIGVAATKTFLSQCMVLFLWAGALARHHGSLDRAALDVLYEGLVKLPHLIKEDLTEGSEVLTAVKAAAVSLQNAKGFFFMGRGLSFPLALEGALKLKEIAYVHAEGYAAGELKHGPIAMIDAEMAVVVLAPRDRWHDKTVSNLEEVKARGARILSVGEREDGELRDLSEFWIPVGAEGNRSLPQPLLPFLITPVVQLLSYEIALLKGTDVDKPRNLAKSVTVE
jgi:glucosamine--fructose-6-phosphate aminotransferase (isomerizing)